MKSILLLLGFTAITLSGCSQTAPANKESTADLKIGGSCEGCEAIYESPVAFDKLENMVWLPDWNEKGTRLAVNGIVYKADGKTPAAGVIIYIYHTDQKGVYPTKGGEKGWEKRHGYLRAWIKTNEKGEYKFFTLKPASYPNSQNPAHIHVIIKEPGKTAYWIDEYVFDDDHLLTADQRKYHRGLGGSGVLTPADVGNMLKAQRDIYLGKNVPGYPKE